MKKIKLVGSILLGTLLLLSFVNVSHAQPSYVGVKVGDTHTWVEKEDIVKTNESESSNIYWSDTYDFLEAFIYAFTGIEIRDWVGDAYRVEVTNMTDEQSTWDNTLGVGIYSNIYYKNKTMSWLLIHNNSWPDFPLMWVYDPANLSEQTWDHYFSFFQPFDFFIPILDETDYNWLAIYMKNYLYSMAPFAPPNVTVEEARAGIELQFSGSFLDYIAQVSGILLPPLHDVYIRVLWGKDGVLYRFSVVSKADGTLLRFERALGGEEITGYRLSIVLGVGAVGIISFIYLIQRKSRIK